VRRITLAVAYVVGCKHFKQTGWVLDTQIGMVQVRIETHGYANQYRTGVRVDKARVASEIRRPLRSSVPHKAATGRLGPIITI
jgi:hypothetical protein